MGRQPKKREGSGTRRPLTWPELYTRGIEAGIDPEKFWTYTLAEILAVMARRDKTDALQWIHTGHVLALLANINRRKGGKTYGWQDFSPHDYGSYDGPAQPVTAAHFEQGKRWAANF